MAHSRSALRLESPLHRGAESFSFFSHLIGVLGSIALLVWMVVRAEGVLATASYAVYGATLILLFSASTLHHAVQTAAGEERSGLLRRLDHVSIYLFIAGTYTPVCLLGIGGAWGVSVLSVVAGLAVIGVFVKLFAPFTPRWVTSGLYIALGWTAVVAVKPLLDTFSLAALAIMFGGGVVYTVGAVGYALKKPDLWPRVVGFHGVWHVMVLVGAALHVWFILGYVPVG